MFFNSQNRRPSSCVVLFHGLGVGPLFTIGDKEKASFYVWKSDTVSGQTNIYMRLDPPWLLLIDEKL